MLRNEPIQSRAHDLDRRWMYDDYFDLILWYDREGQIHGFQLCYDKPGRERALTWTRDQGFQHNAIDTGNYDPNANNTPILIRGGSFPASRVRDEFLSRSPLLPAEIRDLVLARIDEFRE
jgi:hypothetical protein